MLPEILPKTLMATSLSMCTYNCDGIRNSKTYVSTLDHDIIIMFTRNMDFSSRD